MTTSPSAGLPPPLHPRSTFGVLLDRWHQVISAGSKLRPATVRKYTFQKRHLEALRDVTLADLDRTTILDWHDGMTEARGGSIADNAAILLHVVLEWAWDRGLVPYNQASRMKLGYEAEPRQPLSQEQWCRLLAELHALIAERRDQFPGRRSPANEFAACSAAAAALALLLCAGRVSKVSGAEVMHWRPEVGAIMRPQGKTGPQLIVFGPKLGVPYIAAQVAAARALGFEHIFPSPVYPNQAITTAAVWDNWSIACGLAGIRKVTPHGARTTAAVDAIEAGLPEDFVRDYLNHENLRTTKRYTRLARRPSQRRVAETLDEVRIKAAPAVVGRLLADLGRQTGLTGRGGAA